MEHRAAILRITAVAVSLSMSALVMILPSRAEAANAAPTAPEPATAPSILADPPTITDLSNATSLSASDRSRVQVYATHWTTQLAEATESPEDVKNIRQKLSGPLERGTPTEVFRTEYGSALKEGLGQVMDQGNPHTCVVAMIVLSKVGTESALEQLVDRCGLPGETRRHVRLAAARGCRQMFDSGSLDEAKPNKVTGAARKLASAAEVETDRFTLRHQLEAILAADRTTLTAVPRAQIRGSLVTALSQTAKRASAAANGGSPSAMDLLDAAYAVLYRLRNAFIDPLNMDSSSQREFGKRLGPCLGEMLAAAKDHWMEVQSSPRDKEQCGRIISICERFLSTVDPFVRPNQGSLGTNLFAAWDAGDKNRYSRDLQRWQDVLKRPPY